MQRPARAAPTAAASAGPSRAAAAAGTSSSWRGVAAAARRRRQQRRAATAAVSSDDVAPPSLLQRARSAAAAAATTAAAAALLALDAQLLLPPPPALAATPAALAALGRDVRATTTSSSSTSSGDGLPEVYRRLPPLPTEFPPLPPLPRPQLLEARLSNGLEVVLLEDHEVPLVRGALLMSGGSAASPRDKVGLASIAAAVQRVGGSRAHPGEALDEALEDMAAAIEASAGLQSTTWDFDCSSADAPKVLDLLAELLQQPALPQAKLDLVRRQVLSALDHRDDSAGGVARRELQKLLYGADSIYARTPTRAGVRAITTRDLAAHLAAWQRPDAAILGLSGDFDAREVLRVIEAGRLGEWRPAPGASAAPPPRPRERVAPLGEVLAGLRAAPAPLAHAKQQQQQQPQQQQQQQQQRQLVFLVDRPGADQASVAAGEPGVSLLGDAGVDGAPSDAFALDVLSSHLNGFGGKLFNDLRTRQGLAYSVSLSVDTPVDHPGLIVGQADTAQPARLLGGLRDVLDAARAAPMGAGELAKAKDALLQSFAFNFASSSAQLNRALVFKLLGLPPDYLYRYRAGVAAQQAQQVADAAARRLHPSEQVVVVVGDAARVAPELRAAGYEVRPLVPAPA